jgi:hypothetical protein
LRIDAHQQAYTDAYRSYIVDDVNVKSALRASKALFALDIL